MKNIDTAYVAIIIMSFLLLFNNGLNAQDVQELQEVQEPQDVQEHKSFSPQINANYNDWQRLSLEENVKSEKESYYSMKLEGEEWVKDNTIHKSKESLFNQDGYLTTNIIKNFERDSERSSKYFYNDEGELIKISRFHNDQQLSALHIEDWLWVKNERFKNDQLFQSNYYKYDEEKRLVSKLTYVHLGEDSTLLTKRLFEYEANGVCKVKNYSSLGLTNASANSLELTAKKAQEKKEMPALNLMEILTYEGDIIKSETVLDEGGQIQAKTTYKYDEQNQLIKEYTMVFNQSMLNDSVGQSHAKMVKRIEFVYDAKGNLTKEIDNDFILNRGVETSMEYNYENLLVKKETKINTKVSEVIEYTYDGNGSLSTTVKKTYMDGKEENVTLIERSIEYFN